jgi:hypothetical protein
MKISWGLFSILFIVLLLGADGAQARDVFCRHYGIRVYDGGEFQSNWDVVNSAVPRPLLPGHTKPPTGCSMSWRSVGALYRPIEIIEAPRLGTARLVSNYRIYYQSAHSGQDRMTTRVHWTSASSGKPQSAIVHYNITVMDRPL